MQADRLRGGPTRLRRSQILVDSRFPGCFPCRRYGIILHRHHRGNACFAHGVTIRECVHNCGSHFPAVCGVNDIPVPARDEVFRQIAHIIDNNRFAARQHFLHGLSFK